MTLTRSESENLFSSSDKLVNSILGKNTSKTYVVIHCDKDEEYNLLKNLNHMPEVREVDVVFGYYDVICKVESSEYKIIENIITKVIRTLPHVRTSMTLNLIEEQEN